MKFQVTVLAVAVVLPSVMAAGLPKPKTWQVDFWSGQSCSGIETGRPEVGPKKPEKGAVCYPIPDHGVTQAATFYGDGSRYTLSFHKNNMCKDAAFQYAAVEELPTCLTIPGNAIYYQVTTS